MVKEAEKGEKAARGIVVNEAQKGEKADRATGLLLDGGNIIPLGQIVAGPLRARLAFATYDDTQVRPSSHLTEEVPCAVGTSLRSS